jgi:hypothetical protein
MFNPNAIAASMQMPLLETPARSLMVESIIAPVHSDVDIETAIIRLGREPGGGLVVLPGAFTLLHRAPMISAAARNNVPAVYPNSAWSKRADCSPLESTERTSFVAPPLMSIAFCAARSRAISRSSFR